MRISHRFSCGSLLPLACLWSSLASAEDPKVDVCVYGGTAGGVMAAVAAASDGRSVLLIEPSRHIGGMTGGGIGTIDYGVRRTVGGLTDKFFSNLHPATRNAPNQLALETGLKDLLTKQKVQVILEHRLASVRREGTRIVSIELELAPPDRLGAPAAVAKPDPHIVVTARVFVDGSYEGDLMARAGVSYATGREAAATYGEPDAGRRPPMRVFPVDPYRIPGQPSSGLLPLVEADDGKAVGEADNGVPACNFRLQITKDPSDRAPFPKADPYDPQRYEILGRWFAAQSAKGEKIHCPIAIYNKNEANEERTQLVSLALIGGLRDYLDGDWPTRARIWKDHEQYTFGLFQFLATDPRVPEAMRKDFAEWGLSRSAFPETDGWPHQLYIRQGRRMCGAYVVTQNDMMGKTQVEDSIGLGSYKIDIYHSRRYACAGGIALEGMVFKSAAKPPAQSKQDNNGSLPYPISYRALTPKPADCDNLLVPVCLSCSHVACSSIRMEPVYMLLGEAAGHAASQAVTEDHAVQTIDIGKLREHLRSCGQVLELPTP